MHGSKTKTVVWHVTEGGYDHHENHDSMRNGHELRFSAGSQQLRDEQSDYMSSACISGCI